MMPPPQWSTNMPFIYRVTRPCFYAGCFRSPEVPKHRDVIVDSRFPKGQQPSYLAFVAETGRPGGQPEKKRGVRKDKDLKDKDLDASTGVTGTDRASEQDVI